MATKKIFSSCQDHIDTAIAFLKDLDPLKQWMFEFSPFKINRTREMENHWHGMLRFIANSTGIDFHQIRHLAKIEYFGEHEEWLPVHSEHNSSELDSIREALQKLLKHSRTTMPKEERADCITIISTLVDRAFGKKTDANGKNFRIYRYTGDTSKLNVEEYQSLIHRTAAWAATEMGVTLP
jgi:hypothetical protein